MQSRSIFWIDDDFPQIASMMDRLKESGYKVISLRTYSEAIEAISELKESALLILDVILPPGQNASEEIKNQRYLGVTLLEYLQDEHGFQKPVIILSIVTKKEILQRLKRRTYEIMYKPLTTSSQIKVKVEEILGKS